MLWVFALSAVLNLALGYVLAVYLASHCPSCAAAGGFTEELAAAQSPHANALTTPADAMATPAPEQLVGALQQIQRDAATFHECLAETEGNLRDAAPTADEFSAILKSVLGAAENYTRQRDAAHAVVADLQNACPEIEPAIQAIDSAVQSENIRIADARQAAATAADSEEARSAWMGALNGMLDANAAVRQHVGDALAALGAEATGGPSADFSPEDFAAARSRVAQWLEAEDHEPLSLALVDLDGGGELSRRHGEDAMNKAIAAVTGRLAELHGEGNFAAVSDQRFLLRFRGHALRDAFEPVERARQSIERMRFVRGDESIHLTACCAIAEAAPGESADVLLRRAEATLAEAKSSGRNRTFVHQDGTASPLIPIEMSVEERELEV